MGLSKDPYLPAPLAHLENEKIWVCFDLIPQSDGKTKKIPINPHSGLPAKINDPRTWGTFQEAKGALSSLSNDPGARHKPRYLGFAVTPEIGLIFIDLDHVIDRDTRKISEDALAVVEKVNSYVEYSQSRTGLHIYAKGVKNNVGCRKGFIEIYDRDRFACITNDSYGEIRPLRETTKEIIEICDQYFPKSSLQEAIVQEADNLLSISDRDILAIASSAKNGPKFNRLYYRGDVGEYGDDESAADQGLMNILVFYTRNEEQLERLFSQSTLGQRSKWQERRDYRQKTIRASLVFVQETYKHQPRSASQRQEIIVSQGNLHLATDAAEEIIRSHGNIYQRGGRLVRVIPAATRPPNTGINRSENSYLITDVTSLYLTELLTQTASWAVLNREGDKKYIDCPEKIPKTLLAREQWDLPILRGLIYAPTLRPDGSIFNQPGYDPTTGLLLLDQGMSWESIPDTPDKQEALDALKVLRMVLNGFPFANGESESVAIAGILTALIRKSISTAPMFGITAPKMGSGKSLLADCIALIATGKPNSVLSMAENEIEERKRLLSVLKEGDLMICYDNIERPFGSPSLCSILTQKEFKDRVLGGSNTATVPTDCCFLATGNNLSFIGDLSTRTVLCQLDAQVERPEERFFSINLHQYITENRPRLVMAVLTILRAYHVAGRPKQNIKQFGRFEEWSDWIRSALVWLGLPDPCLTRKEIESTDSVRTDLAMLLSVWHSTFGSSSIKVKDLVAKSNASWDHNSQLKEALCNLAGNPKGDVSERWLGNNLKKYKNRIEHGYRLEIAGELQGTTLWKVTKIN